jgi:hypothetical protein
MKYQNPRQKRSGLNAGDRRQLFLLGALLVFVLFAMRIAALPSSWSWMFPEVDETRTGDHATTVSPPSQSPGDGSDEITGIEITGSEIEIDRTQASQSEGTDSPKIDLNVRKQTQEQPDDSKPRASRPRIATAIDPAIFGQVRDNTLGIRPTESDAYYHVLSHVRNVKTAAMESVVQSDATYALLMREPRHFRGDVVAVEGEVKRLLELPAEENPYGLRHLYEAWIVTADSGSGLYRVVCSAVDSAIPTGESINESVRVRVIGYFFKREGYAARSGLRSAPLILAHRIDLIGAAAPSGARTREWASPQMIALFLLFACVVVWRVYAISSRFRGRSTRQVRSSAPRTLTGLDGIETTDVRDELRRLAEEEPSIDDSDEPTDLTPADRKSEIEPPTM